MKSLLLKCLGKCDRFVPVAAGIAVVFSGSVAQANVDRQSLIENSPFIWEGYAPPQDRRPPREPAPEPPADDPLDRLELRGIIVMGGETRVSFFHPDNQEGFWMPLDGSEGGYTLVGFDGGDSVMVRRGDRERSITLNEVQVAEMPRQQQGRQQQGRQQQGRQQQGGRQQGEAQQASTQESVDQLRQAAQELRNRRALPPQN